MLGPQASLSLTLHVYHILLAIESPKDNSDKGRGEDYVWVGAEIPSPADEVPILDKWIQN